MTRRRHTRRASPLTPSVAVIGAGKVGLVLGKILADNGARITCVVSRTSRSARAGGRFLSCRNTATHVSAIPRGTDFLLIATPHSAVQDVAEALAREVNLVWRSTSVCHASGMHTAAVLAPLKALGATVFSFHPLQTFPRDFSPRDIVPSARGIRYGVDGTAEALRKARMLARSLEGHVVVVPPALRVFYHAACVVASNHLTGLLADLETMSRRLGFGRRESLEAFRPIIEATLTNVFRTSPARALSGPVARGGVDTVRAHLEAVRDHAPELLPYFVRMTDETVRLATEKGSLSAATLEAFRTLLASFSGNPAPQGGTQ